MPENFSEPTLVMVEALLGLVVDGANIDYDVAGVENGRVAATLKAWNELDLWPHMKTAYIYQHRDRLQSDGAKRRQAPRRSGKCRCGFQ